MWGNVKLTLKCRQFDPQFETFLSLKSYVAKKPFRIIEYLQQDFLTQSSVDAIEQLNCKQLNC